MGEVARLASQTPALLPELARPRLRIRDGGLYVVSYRIQVSGTFFFLMRTMVFEVVASVLKGV